MSDRIESLEKLAKEGGATPETVAAEIAKIFGVKRQEVGLLEVRGELLRFVLPQQLRTAGSIPLSSYSVAARTVRTRKAEVFNTFAQVKHSRLFEFVPLEEPQVIQKLMSAPVLDGEGNPMGVLQISRKGNDLPSAGPDFTKDDLDNLRLAADIVAKLMPSLAPAQ